MKITLCYLFIFQIKSYLYISVYFFFQEYIKVLADISVKLNILYILCIFLKIKYTEEYTGSFTWYSRNYLYVVYLYIFFSKASVLYELIFVRFLKIKYTNIQY